MAAPKIHHSEEIRQKVVELHQAGKGYGNIASNLNLLIILIAQLVMKKSTVQSIIKKFKNTGSITDLPKSGRPKLLGDRQLRSMIREVRQDP